LLWFCISVGNIKKGHKKDNQSVNTFNTNIFFIPVSMTPKILISSKYP